MKLVQLERPIDEHLKPLKDSDGTSTSLELSTDKIRVKDLEVTGTATGVFTDDTKLPLAGGTMSGNVDFGDARLTNLQRVQFNDGGYITEIVDNDDMSSVSATKLASSESTKVYIDNHAGTILAYRDIGLNETAATYDLTTSYVVPTDEFGVTFVAPPSGNVEMYMQVSSDMGSSSAGDLHAGLSTANATSGYSALASYHEVELLDGVARGAVTTITHSWTLTGLTAGTSYTYYTGFKSTSTSGTPKLLWGGDATGEYPDIIIKAIALPSSIST